jgi:hypothetical protein
MFKTKKISLVSPCVATVAALMTPLLCSSVQAASVGLADVSIAGSGQADYVFSNDTTLATYNTIPGGAPVNFTYEQANIGGHSIQP